MVKNKIKKYKKKAGTISETRKKQIKSLKQPELELEKVISVKKIQSLARNKLTRKNYNELFGDTEHENLYFYPSTN